MGKYILCAGNITKEPFVFPVTGVRVFSIEEMCFYLYENIYLITPDLFDEKLNYWLAAEAGLPETAEKLKRLSRGRHDLKDLVVTILCSCDFYEEEEIKYLVRVMEKLEHMSPMEKRKLHGDNYLRFHDYASAGREYESILDEMSEKKNSGSYRGAILHNLAITRIHTISYKAAADTFYEAFEKNQETASLKAYMEALYIAREDDRFVEELERFHIDEEEARGMIEEIEESMLQAEQDELYQRIVRLQEIRKAGQMEEFQLKTATLLNHWKEEYRFGLS